MSRLTPGDMPHNDPVRVVKTTSDDGGDPIVIPEFQPVMQELTEGLQKLREPFPQEMIEKLPKPLWKGAWDGESKGHCGVCGGYHPLTNTIHLDYVGHANATNRLLEIDPFWEWEPLSYTETGLPLFDKVGGLWIRLTICGVTRLGYGDGANPKEIIGDAIRNAAMRFGVALDLWAKIDLHAERNPGDGKASGSARGTTGQGVGEATQEPQRDDRRVSGRQTRGQDEQTDQTPEAARTPNQDSLDSLGEVCDEHGYDRRTMRDAYARWAASKRYKDRELLTADGDRIIKFAAKLIEDATAEPEDTSSDPANDPDASGEGSVAEDDSDEAQALDTSDVEKRPGDAF